jgi:hypothetical protein
VNNLVWKQYKEQDHRGTQGFGVFDGHFTHKAAMEKRMRRWFRKPQNESDMILFHHRFPTSTINTKQTAHPFNTSDFFGDVRYVLVHNGVIRNSHELKTKHEAMGIEYQTTMADGKFNDSEALLWDFALTMEKKQEKLQAFGDVAFVCIRLEAGVPTRMYFGRNYARPLNLWRNPSGVMISSEGEGTEVKEDKLYTYNYQLKRLTTKPFEVPTFDKEAWRRNLAATAGSYSNSNSLGRYPNYGDSWARGYDDDDYLVDASGYAYYPNESSTTWDDDEDDDNLSDDIDYYQPALTDDDESSMPILIRDLLLPTSYQISERYWQYLQNAAGKYSTAYWHAYADALLLKEEKQTVKVRCDRILLDKVCARLITDKGYVDDNSIHSFWLATVPINTQLEIINHA